MTAMQDMAPARIPELAEMVDTGHRLTGKLCARCHLSSLLRGVGDNWHGLC